MVNECQSVVPRHRYEPERDFGQIHSYRVAVHAVETALRDEPHREDLLPLVGWDRWHLAVRAPGLAVEVEIDRLEGAGNGDRGCQLANGEMLGVGAQFATFVGDDLRADVGGALSAGLGQVFWFDANNSDPNDLPSGVSRVTDFAELADRLVPS